jgi:hypothetical protein
VAYFKVLSEHLTGKAKENYKILFCMSNFWAEIRTWSL